MPSPKSKRLSVNKTKKGEETRMVKFLNIEFPGADLMFTKDTHKVGTPPNTNPRRWHLKDGEVYKLPVFIIEHLNSLTIPEHNYEIDPRTEQIRSQRTGERNRFSLSEVFEEKPKKAVNA